MKKQAQLNQVFVWIIVALVVGAIALIGVRSIGSLVEDKCSIDLIRFEDNLREKISLNNDFGSVNLEQVAVPCNYAKLCLVDARAIENQEQVTVFDPEVAASQSLIRNSVEDGVETNVFLFNADELRPSGYISQLRLNKEDTTETRVLCIDPQGGRFSMVLEGLGRNTYVQAENTP